MERKINIWEAPRPYRKYLTAGDTHGGKEGENCRIDDLSEAQKSADNFCLEKPEEDCRQFLEYLKGKGFPVSAKKQEPFREEEVEDIARRTKMERQQIKELLERFQEKGLVDKFGKVQIREFLIKVAETSKEGARASFFALEKLADEGVVEKTGLLSLNKLSKTAGEETAAVYEALLEYPEIDGLPEIRELEMKEVSVSQRKQGGEGPFFNKKGEKKLPQKNWNVPVVGFLVQYRFAYNARTHDSPAEFRIEIPETRTTTSKSHKESGDCRIFIKSFSKGNRLPSKIGFEVAKPGDYSATADVYKIFAIVLRK